MACGLGVWRLGISFDSFIFLPRLPHPLLPLYGYLDFNWAIFMRSLWLDTFLFLGLALLWDLTKWFHLQISSLFTFQFTFERNENFRAIFRFFGWWWPYKIIKYKKLWTCKISSTESPFLWLHSFGWWKLHLLFQICLSKLVRFKCIFSDLVYLLFLIWCISYFWFGQFHTSDFVEMQLVPPT